MAYTGPNTVIANLSTEIEAAAVAYGEIAGRLAAADGDRAAALKAFIETSVDAEVVKMREAIAKLNERLHAKAEESVKSETLSDEDKAKLTVEASTLKEQVQKGQKAVTAVLAGFDTDREGVEKWLAEFKERDSTRKSRTLGAGQTGSTLPRVNVRVTVSGGAFTTPETFETFAAVAQKLKTEVKDLQVAFANAAGVKHEDIKTVDKPVTFTFKPQENGAEYTLATTPKEVKKSGRAAANANKAVHSSAAGAAVTVAEAEKAATA